MEITETAKASRRRGETKISHHREVSKEETKVSHRREEASEARREEITETAKASHHR